MKVTRTTMVLACGLFLAGCKTMDTGSLGGLVEGASMAAKALASNCAAIRVNTTCKAAATKGSAAMSSAPGSPVNKPSARYSRCSSEATSKASNV